MTYQDVETYGLILFSVIFFFLEKKYPKHENLGVREQLKKDVLAFFILILGVNVSRLLAIEFFTFIHLESVTLIRSSSHWPLYWFSGFRTSLTHAFIYAFPQVFVGFYLFEFTPIELGSGFVLGVVSNLFTHSNIAVPEWLKLHWVLVTPDFHHPHHSQLGTQNKNFGNVFTLWDRLFGTYVDPEKIRKDFKYGLKEKPSDWRMMIGL